MVNLGQELKAAILERDRERIEDLLEHGADPNAVIPDEDFAAIHLAAGTTRSITKLLLKNGANPNLQTSEGSTPLHIAASWGKTDIVKVLLKYGADESIRDKENLGAIEVAKNYEFWDCLSILQNPFKKRLKEQLVMRKEKKRGLRQSVDSPAQVHVDVHRKRINVFTELIDSKSNGGKTSSSYDAHSRSNSVPLMSAIFNIPRQMSGIDKDSDSVTSSENSSVSSSIKRKKEINSSCSKQYKKNPNVEDFYFVGRSLDTELDEVSTENISESGHVGITKVNQQKCFFHIGDESGTRKKDIHPTSKSNRKMSPSSSNHQNHKFDNLKNSKYFNHCPCTEIGECSYMRQPPKYQARPEMNREYMMKKEEQSESDSSTQNMETVSTVISTLPIEVSSSNRYDQRLGSDYLDSEKNSCYRAERGDKNSHSHHEGFGDQIKHRQGSLAEHISPKKKSSDLLNSKKTESKCRDSSTDAYCFCNKQLHIKIDLRLGPLKSDENQISDSNSSKSNSSVRSQNSTLQGNVSISCHDNSTGSKWRAATPQASVQLNTFHCENHPKGFYRLTSSDVLNHPDVQRTTNHNLHKKDLHRDALKHSGSETSFTQKNPESHVSDDPESFNKAYFCRGCCPHFHLAPEEANLQPKLLKDKFLKDLKTHLRI